MKKAGLDRLAALYTAIETVRRGGTVSLSGVYGMADPLPMMSLFDKQIQLRMGQANMKRWIPDIMPFGPMRTRSAWMTSPLTGCRSGMRPQRTACSTARPTPRSRSCSSRGADPTVIIRNLFYFSKLRVRLTYPQSIRLEKVVTSPTYDPTSGPVDPGVKQSPPRLDEAAPFADSEMEYPRTEGSGERYDQPGASGSEGGSTVDTAKGEAANVKDTAADAASGVKDVATSEVSNVASEAKSQVRNLVDQTRSQLRGQATNQQSQLASRLNSWASELGSMASRSEDSGPMTDLAQEASRRVGEMSHWLDNHEPAHLLDEVKRFARRRPVAFLALAAAAGVVAGRVTRGAVAANTSVDSDTDPSPARAYDSDDRGGYDGGLQGGRAHGIRSYQSAGYDPSYGEMAGETSYQGGGMPAPGPGEVR